MTPIVVLSTDTTHHRYLLNRLRDQGLPIQEVIFETTSVQPPFPTGPLYEKEEEEFERQRWPQWLGLDGFTIREVANFNDPDCLAILKELKPKFGVVFGARRLNQPVLESFSDGLVNVHRGIAQEYRGLDSELWAIYHNDWDGIGVTLHLMDADLDSGAIVAQERLELAHGMKTHHLRALTTEIATRMMADVLRDQLAGTLKSTVQSGHWRYYSFMPLDLRKLVRKRFERYCDGLPKP